MPPPAHTPTSANARCMLLVGGGAVPSNLVAALGQRGITAGIARTAPEVMAELAGGQVASVVVVEPERQARAQELYAAASTYHPQVRFWAYAPQAPGREATLSVFADKTGQTPEKSGPASNPCYSSAYKESPPSSAATRASNAHAGPQADTDTTEDDPLRVTEQELAMLLGNDSDPGEAPERSASPLHGHRWEENGRDTGRE